MQDTIQVLPSLSAIKVIFGLYKNRFTNIDFLNTSLRVIYILYGINILYENYNKKKLTEKVIELNKKEKLKSSIVNAYLLGYLLSTISHIIMKRDLMSYNQLIMSLFIDNTVTEYFDSTDEDTKLKKLIIYLRVLFSSSLLILPLYKYFRIGSLVLNFDVGYFFGITCLRLVVLKHKKLLE